jgi:hypothetical protein
MGEALRGIVGPAAIVTALWLGHRALRWLEWRGIVYYLGERR